MSDKLSKITCPTCQAPNTWTQNNSFRPFCSERCKSLDFGGWANESYRFPSDEEDQDLVQNQQGDL